MMRKSYVFLLLLVGLLGATGCEKEAIQPTENLSSLGILGVWKFEKQLIDGIASLAVECCDYIAFEEDDLPDDLKGAFRSYGVGYETTGTFEVNTQDQTMLFEYNARQKTYEYRLEDSTLTFMYRDKGRKIVEDWAKME